MNENITPNERLMALRVQHPFVQIVPTSFASVSYRFTGSESLTTPINLFLPSGTRFIKIRCSPYMISTQDVYCNIRGAASDIPVSLPESNSDSTFVLTNTEDFMYVENLQSVSLLAPMNAGVVSIMCFIQG